MLKVYTPVGQMGLTKRELCDELNEAFAEISGEWENNTSLHLYPQTTFTPQQITNIKNYCERWLEFVNRHNHFWICHLEFLTNNRGFDKGFMMICSWREINRVEVYAEMDDASDTEL
jgi:hypothetical protein